MGATHLLGRRGEELAADLLENAGLQILDRNWRCERGEIDIVARDGTTLVVVEVKTRSSRACGSPREAVTERKLKRLHVLAGVWLVRQCERFSRIRVDIVTVEPGPDGELRAEHVQGVI